MRHSTEARRVRRELDRELAQSAAASGRTLEWSAQDLAVLELIMSAIDRKVDLTATYESADGEPKLRVKLAAEIRLIEGHLARLLKQVKTDIDQPLSQRSLKAQRAANVRWSRDAG